LTLDAVCLEVAAHKSVHIPLVWNDTEMTLMAERVAEDETAQLTMRGVRVPFVEADVGTRFLGFHMDLLGDYGEQLAKLEAIIDDFGQRIRKARVSKGLVMYLVEAVLIPRVMYPMSVAPFTPNQIRTLESRALKWILPKLGLTPTFSRDLLHSPLEWGGFGWDAWTTRVTDLKSNLAMDMSQHMDPTIRGCWLAMKARHEDGKDFLSTPGFGGASGEELRALESAVSVTWLQTFSALLSVSGMAWEDGAGPHAPRQGDLKIKDIAREAVRSQRWTAQRGETVSVGAERADFLWISQLLGADGNPRWPWHELPRWKSWTEPLLQELEEQYQHALPLGPWNNQETGVHQACWGEGIRTEGLVTDLEANAFEQSGVMRVGVVRGMAVSGTTPGVRVEWLKGAWCCTESCSMCAPMAGQGKVLKAAHHRWGRGEGEISSNPTVVVDPRRLRRLWGGEANLQSKGGRRMEIWSLDGVNEEIWSLVTPLELEEELTHLPTPHPLDDCWAPDRSKGHWISEPGVSVEMVNQVWASGGTVTAVSDGSLVRGRRGGEHFLPVERDRLSCGWVLGHDLGGATGADRTQLLEIGRGGYRIAAEGCVSSSYLTELAGALDVLCTLMDALGEGDRPGAVQHWCDNEGVVTLICARRDVVPRKWRKTPCQHLCLGGTV